jgi:hypothetical protein
LLLLLLRVLLCRERRRDDKTKRFVISGGGRSATVQVVGDAGYDERDEVAEISANLKVRQAMHWQTIYTGTGLERTKEHEDADNSAKCDLPGGTT